jgi:hypothetical protein
VQLASAGEDSVLVVAAPKVHQAASITLDCNGGGSPFSPWTTTRESLHKQVEALALQTHRSVIGILDGEIVHYVDPNKEAQ